MTLPTDTPAAPASNINMGNVTESVVQIGNGNRAEYYAAGAVVIKDAASLTASRRDGRITSLASRLENFVGRKQDLDDLKSAVQASGKISLWADNGMGKTALAAELMDSLKTSDPTQNIIYLDTMGRHGDDLLLALYDFFYERPALAKAVYKPTPEQMSMDLKQVQGLVFVENPDLLGKDISLLLNAAKQCSFVFIAPKRILMDGKAVRLQGLPDSDAIDLFSKPYEDDRHPLDDAGKQDGIQVCELLRGIPDLVIRLAVRGADNDETPAQLLVELRAAGVDDAALAKLTTASLDANEKKVLMFIAVAGDDTPVPEDLLNVLGDRFPGLDVRKILDHLLSLHLAQAHSPRYSLSGALPSVLNSAWDLTAARDEMLDIAMNWLPTQKPSEPVLDSLPLMQRVLAEAADREKWPEVIRLGRSLEGFVFRYGRWQAWVDVLNILLRAAKATASAALEGWALHQLGSRALADGALNVASTYLSQALKIREAIHDGPGLEVTRHNLDVLKAASAPAHGDGSGRGGSGGHPLTYGFLGFVGLVVLAVAGYTLFRPRPAPPVTKPAAPPFVHTTSAPIIPPTSTPPATEPPASTPTHISTDTPVPTAPDTPTDTPAPQAPFGAIVTGVDSFLACHYGPGKPYLLYGLVNLRPGDKVQVQGWIETVDGTWALVQYTPPYGKPPRPCWVNPNYLKMDGDLTALPQADPHIVMPYFTDARYVPGVFPPPTVTDVTRDGNSITVSVEGKDLVYIDESHTDREAPGSPLFLVEFWVCKNGKLLLDPQGIWFQYDPSQDTASGSAQSTDDGSCGKQPYGYAYLAHRDGYVGPVPFQVSP